MVVDSRADYLDADWPANATPVLATEPERIVAHCPANSYYLVMTHDHAIDLVLCQAILARDDRAFCGLIGSRSKQRRFEKKLRAAGIDEATLATLTCPIGIDSIGGKQPGQIAIATAAQVVGHHQQRLRTKAGANEQRDTADIDSPPGDNQPMHTDQQPRNMPPKPQAR
jgi:xanthine dehydrogenase accessory factor